MLVALLTAPRPAEAHLDYFRRTIVRIDETGGRRLGASRKIVVGDGWQPEMPPGWEFCSCAGGDSVAAFHRILELAKDADTDLLFFEDDIALCDNAVTAAERLIVPPDLAFVTLFDADHRGLEVGLHARRFPGAFFRCSQALKIPLRTVHFLLQDGPPMPKEAAAGLDTRVGRLLFRGPWPQYGIVAPSWVEHLGDASALMRRKISVKWRRLVSANPWPPGFDPLLAFSGYLREPD